MCNVSARSSRAESQDGQGEAGIARPSGREGNTKPNGPSTHTKAEVRARRAAMAARWNPPQESDQRKTAMPLAAPSAGQRKSLASRWAPGETVVEAKSKDAQKPVLGCDVRALTAKWKSGAAASEAKSPEKKDISFESLGVDLSEKRQSYLAGAASLGAEKAKKDTSSDGVQVNLTEKRQAYLTGAAQPRAVLRSVNPSSITVSPKLVKDVTEKIEEREREPCEPPERVDPQAPEGNVALYSKFSNLKKAFRESMDELDGILGANFTNAAIHIASRASHHRYLKEAPAVSCVGPLNSGKTSVAELLTSGTSVLPIGGLATTCGVVSLLPSKDDTTSLVEIEDLHDGSTPFERIIASGEEKTKRLLQKHFDEMRAEARRVEELKEAQETERLKRRQAALRRREELIHAREKLMGRQKEEFIIEDIVEEAPLDYSEEALAMEASKENKRLGVRLPFRHLPGHKEEYSITLQDTGGYNELGNGLASGAVMEAILTGDGMVWVESKSSATTGSALHLLSRIQLLRPDILSGKCDLVRVVITKCDQKGMGETPREDMVSIIQKHWRSLGCELPSENIVFLCNGAGRKRLEDLRNMSQANDQHIVLDRSQKFLLKACTRELPSDTSMEDRLKSPALQRGIAQKLEAMGTTALVDAMHQLARSLHNIAALDPVTAADSALRVLRRPLECAIRTRDCPNIRNVLRAFEAAERVVSARTGTAGPADP